MSEDQLARYKAIKVGMHCKNEEKNKNEKTN